MIGEMIKVLIIDEDVVMKGCNVRTALLCSVAVERSLVHEEPVDGSGAGVLVLAYTSSGMVLAASGVVERGERAEDVGARVGAKLVEELSHGGCTDEFLSWVFCSFFFWFLFFFFFVFFFQFTLITIMIN